MLDADEFDAGGAVEEADVAFVSDRHVEEEDPGRAGHRELALAVDDAVVADETGANDRAIREFQGHDIARTRTNRWWFGRGGFRLRRSVPRELERGGPRRGRRI